MNNQTPFDRHRQLRDVAIFVASLDEVMAQRLLDSMPPRDAVAVLAEVDELEAIDPEEQREIVEKFRRSLAPSPARKVEGVELDASLLAKIENRDAEEIYSNTQASQLPLTGLSDTEATTITEILSAEHPQTIAIVLSRIDASSAADLMSKLSLSLQAEVLARMGNLDTADEQTVKVIESQLNAWLEQQRQRKQRQAAGMELVQRILKHTPEAQRHTILAHMKKNNPAVPNPTLSKSTSTGTQKRLAELAKPLQNEERYSSFQVETRGDMQPLSSKPTTSSNFNPEKNLSSDPLTELEQTNDATLMTALSRTDRQVGALALAGASEALMKRVLRGLPRRKAKTMRHQLRAIGPTKLSDMLAAQHQLLKVVRQLAPQ